MQLAKTINAQAPVMLNIEAKFYDQRTLSESQQKFNKKLNWIMQTFPRLKNKLWKYYNLGELSRVDEKKNIICNAGFNAITKRLTGDLTFTGTINKALLGTGAATPAVGDTTLVNEVYRNDMASGTDSANIAILTAFYSEVEVTGTFTEFGNVIDGTASADTGELWSFIGSLNWVKDNQTVLVVSQKYTFASV